MKLTTLTKEFFVPGFLERDEGEREPPCDKYPWDGISGVKPFRGVAQQRRSACTETALVPEPTKGVADARGVSVSVGEVNGPCGRASPVNGSRRSDARPGERCGQ